MDFDNELAAMIQAEWEGTGGKPTAEEPAEPEVGAVAPDALVPSAWPRWRWYSEAFGAKKWLSATGRRDLPVPDCTPTDWPEKARAMIPALPPYWEHNHETMWGIALALLCNDTTLLTGPTGTGKTSSVIAFGAVTGIPVWIQSFYNRMESSDIVGSSSLRADPATGANITEYNPTVFINSMRYGGIFCGDEIFRAPPSVLMSMQSALEARHTIVLADADGLSDEERVLVAPKDKWWPFLTDNTTGTGDHTGNYSAEVQDVSSLDRVLSTLYVDYNKPAVERKILARAAPALSKDTIKNIVSTGSLVREAFKQNKVMQTMSMRALLSWSEKAIITGCVDTAFRQAFFTKLDPVSAGVVAECYRQVWDRGL